MLSCIFNLFACRGRCTFKYLIPFFSISTRKKTQTGRKTFLCASIFQLRGEVQCKGSRIHSLECKSKTLVGLQNLTVVFFAGEQSRRSDASATVRARRDENLWSRPLRGRGAKERGSLSFPQVSSTAFRVGSQSSSKRRLPTVAASCGRLWMLLLPPPFLLGLVPRGAVLARQLPSSLVEVGDAAYSASSPGDEGGRGGREELVDPLSQAAPC